VLLVNDSLIWISSKVLIKNNVLFKNPLRVSAQKGHSQTLYTNAKRRTVNVAQGIQLVRCLFRRTQLVLKFKLGYMFRPCRVIIRPLQFDEAVRHKQYNEQINNSTSISGNIPVLPKSFIFVLFTNRQSSRKKSRGCCLTVQMRFVLSGWIRWCPFSHFVTALPNSEVYWLRNHRHPSYGKDYEVKLLVTWLILRLECADTKN
jgi:hypothetical protein